MTTYVIRGVRPYGEDAVDLVVTDGVITELAPVGSGKGEVIEADGLIGFPALLICTHICVSQVARMPKPSNQVHRQLH